MFGHKELSSMNGFHVTYFFWLLCAIAQFFEDKKRKASSINETNRYIFEKQPFLMLLYYVMWNKYAYFLFSTYISCEVFQKKTIVAYCCISFCFQTLFMTSELRLREQWISKYWNFTIYAIKPSILSSIQP